MKRMMVFILLAAAPAIARKGDQWRVTHGTEAYRELSDGALLAKYGSDALTRRMTESGALAIFAKDTVVTEIRVSASKTFVQAQTPRGAYWFPLSALEAAKKGAK